MKRRAILAVLALASGAAFAQPAAPSLGLGKGSEVKTFRVPDFDEQGIMTSQIFGDEAKMLSSGNIEVTKLRMEFYAYENGERRTDMTVASPLCQLDQKKGMITSTSEIEITRDEFSVTGTGFSFQHATRELNIYSNSMVILRGASKAFDPAKEIMK